MNLARGLVIPRDPMDAANEGAKGTCAKRAQWGIADAIPGMPAAAAPRRRRDLGWRRSLAEVPGRDSLAAAG